MKKNYLFLLLFALMTTTGISAADFIGVSSPAYCSEIQGNTTINVFAPTTYTGLDVHCWKQGTANGGQGTYTLITTVSLNESGTGSFVFPADEYPHGPLTIRIAPTTGKDNRKNCYLQLYNKGGVSWKEGLPANPPAAAGMKLVFADDFDSELSIGNDPFSHTYYDHKPPYGTQDFSSIRFTDFNSPNNPFSQVGTYLRIRADANKNSTGLISSMFSNNMGFSAEIPSYFECRFVGPNVSGSWPAFWLLSKKDRMGDNTEPCDELDIIESYGYLLESEKQWYRVTAHAWGDTQEQKEAQTNICEPFYRNQGVVDPYKHGILGTWFDVPHIYGCKITEEYTTYYFDDIEVAKHKTLPISKRKPLYFLINLATTGAVAPVDLSRYNGIMDMYVDYVRVYSGASTSIPSIEQPEVNVEIYPNPASSEMTISFNSPNLADIFVGIYDTLGQQKSSYQEYRQGEVNIPVDMSNMSNGFYLAKINIGNVQVNKKFIKK